MPVAPEKVLDEFTTEDHFWAGREGGTEAKSEAVGSGNRPAAIFKVVFKFEEGIKFLLV